MIVEGIIYNLSFDSKRILPGWGLLITENDEEFLIRQNGYFVGLHQFKVRRKIYQANISLKKFTQPVTESKKKNDMYLGITMSIPLGALLRSVLPKDWMFGNINLPIDVLEGVTNLFFFWIALLIGLFAITMLRKMRLVLELKRNEGSMMEIGSGYAITPLKVTEKILKWW